MFAKLEKFEKTEIVNDRTRRIMGDGTEFLIVPGLKSLEAVTVGEMPLPLTETRRFLEDSTGRETEPRTLPMVSLQKTSDGRPVLLRSELSNNGRWQKDVPIFVAGDWEDEPKPAKAAADKAGK